MQSIVELSLAQLHAHPLNSNVMEERLVAKLAGHIASTGRYPPIIVRPLPDAMTNDPAPAYQLLDGHHRVEALRRTGMTTARCVIWEVNDAEALTLLATLNRLQGGDDPHKRARLVDELAKLTGTQAARLSTLLPETADQLDALTALTTQVRLRPPRLIDDLPTAVHFFLTREQRSELESILRSIGGSREAALMACVRIASQHSEA